MLDFVNADNAFPISSTLVDVPSDFIHGTHTRKVS